MSDMDTSLDLSIGDIMRSTTRGSAYDSLVNQRAYESRYEQPNVNVQSVVFEFQHVTELHTHCREGSLSANVSSIKAHL